MPKRQYAVRLEEAEAAEFDEVCSQQEISTQKAIRKAVREFVAREQRYMKGKKECENALFAYIGTGEVLDEEDVEAIVAAELRALGVEA